MGSVRCWCRFLRVGRRRSFEDLQWTERRRRRKERVELISFSFSLFSALRASPLKVFVGACTWRSMEKPMLTFSIHSISFLTALSYFFNPGRSDEEISELGGPFWSMTGEAGRLKV